jgi:hypothetical protein
MKNLFRVIMMAAIGTMFPVSTFAKIDPAVLEKQRKENKARIEKGVELRIGKPQKRLFGSSEVDVRTRSLKLDAISPSPRRGAKNKSKKLESALPAKPGGVTSRAEPGHNLEETATPKE